MLYFEAIVRPQIAERLCMGLLEWGEVIDLTASEIIGSGRRYVAGDRGDYVIDILPKVLVAGYIEDETCDDLIDRLCTRARTGRSGDGKVWIIKVESEL